MAAQGNHPDPANAHREGRVARNTLVYALADLANKGMGFLLIPLYTAFLSPHEYGIVSIGLAVGVGLGVLGLQSMEGGYTRFHFDAVDPVERRRRRGSVWLAHLAYLAAMCGTLEIIGTNSGILNIAGTSYEAHLRYVVWTVFFTNAIILLPKALSLARQRPVAFVAINSGLVFCSTAFIVLFVVVLGDGASGYLKGSMYGAALVSVPVLAVCLKNVELRPRLQDVQDTLRFVLPLVPHLLALWVLASSDRFILEWNLTLRDVGVYALGYQLASIVQLVAFSMNAAVTPHYFKVASQESEPTDQLLRIGRYYLLVVVWVAVGVVVLGDDALALAISNPKYAGAFGVVPILATAFVARGLYFVFVNAVYYSKHVAKLPFATFAAAASGLGLNFVLIPMLGVFGAAISILVAFAVHAVLVFRLAQTVFPLDYNLENFFRILAVGAIWAAFSVAVSPPPGWPGLAAGFALSAAFPLAAFLGRAVRREDLAAVRAVVMPSRIKTG